MQCFVHYIAWLHKTHILQAFASKWHILSCRWTRIPVCLDLMSGFVCVVPVQYTYIRKKEKKRIITKYIMKPCIHSAGKRTLHPNSTLLCHVHFLSSVLSCGVFTFKVFLVISEPDKRGYVRFVISHGRFWREKLLSFPNYKGI